MLRAFRSSRILLPRERSRDASEAIGIRKHDCVAREQTVCCRFMTRFGDFLEANEFSFARLARRSGISRQHIYRLRMGTMNATRETMIMLALAPARILHRTLQIS